MQNNYLIFAGKCWKIVRIDGNGNIRLWLWNDANSCTANSVPSSAFNEKSDNNAYIGYMYGDINSNVISNATGTGLHDNINDSTILTNLKTWYDDTFNTSDNENPNKYTDLLADVIWCNDKRIHSGTGLGTTTTTYLFYVINSSSLSLKCPDFGVSKDVSRFTAYKNTDENNAKGNGKLRTVIDETTPTEFKYYKIGLLTAQEVIYAGAKSGTDNSNYYLKSGSDWWTMTPINTSSNQACSTVIRHSTRPNSGFYVKYSYQMHPSIALIPTVQVTYNTGGTDAPGTVNNPYVVSVN